MQEGMWFGTWRVSGERYFRADHLLLFIIQDREKGNILFMGPMMNSTE
jgi:serine protease inhibitor